MIELMKKSEIICTVVLTSECHKVQFNLNICACLSCFQICVKYSSHTLLNPNIALSMETISRIKLASPTSDNEDESDSK